MFPVRILTYRFQGDIHCDEISEKAWDKKTYSRIVYVNMDLLLPYASQLTVNEKRWRSQLLKSNPHLQLVFWIILLQSWELGESSWPELYYLKPQGWGWGCSSRAAFSWSDSGHWLILSCTEITAHKVPWNTAEGKTPALSISSHRQHRPEEAPSALLRENIYSGLWM